MTVVVSGTRWIIWSLMLWLVSTQTLFRSVLLTPNNNSHNGANVQTINSDVKTDDNTWDIFVENQNGFHLQLSLDKSWKFHSTLTSKIELVIKGNTNIGTNTETDLSLLVTFSVNNNEYINTFLPLNTIYGGFLNQIYPICTTNPNEIAWGNINDTMNLGPHPSATDDHRWDIAIGNRGNYWSYEYEMQPPNRPNKWPLTLQLINHPMNNTMDLYFIAANNTFIQQCKYESFTNSSNGIDILLAVDDYDQHLTLTELLVTYYVNLSGYSGISLIIHITNVILIHYCHNQTETTSSPSQAPTISPTETPTQIPDTTTYPTIAKISTRQMTNKPTVRPTLMVDLATTTKVREAGVGATEPVKLYHVTTQQAQEQLLFRPTILGILILVPISLLISLCICCFVNLYQNRRTRDKNKHSVPNSSHLDVSDVMGIQRSGVNVEGVVKIRKHTGNGPGEDSHNSQSTELLTLISNKKMSNSSDLNDSSGISFDNEMFVETQGNVNIMPDEFIIDSGNDDDEDDDENPGRYFNSPSSIFH